MTQANQDGAGAIRMSRVLPASPAVVFKALIRPEMLQRWMCPEDMTVAMVETDPRLGGKFVIAMQGSDGVITTARGHYTEIRAPHVLAFTWAWDKGHSMAGVQTDIRIELTAQGEHTFLLMTHFGIPTDDERSSHHQGWTSVLSNLNRYLEQTA